MLKRAMLLSMILLRGRVQRCPGREVAPVCVKRQSRNVEQKRKKKGKSLSVSKADFVSGPAKAQVVHVKELRKKREEDAKMCGRSMRTVHTLGQGNSRPDIPNVNPSVGVGDTSTQAGGGFPQARCSLSNPGVQRSEGMEDLYAAKEGGMVSPEECIGTREHVLPRCHGKERVEVHVEEAAHLEALSSKRRGKDKEFCSGKDREFELEKGLDEPPFNLRRGSPSSRTKAYNRAEDHHEGTQHVRNASPRGGRGDQWKRSSCSMSRSPSRHFSSKRHGHEFHSSRHSPSRSPGRLGGGRDRTARRELMDYYGRDRIPYRVNNDYEDFLEFRRRDQRRHERQQYASPDIYSPRRRHDSGSSGPKHSEHGWTPEYSTSPPGSRTHKTPPTVLVREGSIRRHDGDMPETSRATERRERRRQQSIRESEMARRQKDGKKPFYLTLDDQGQPYGPGKPAWIAEINKLATGLDPSCTHIRKQTFEAVQTLKDRLNENFDYSGQLNQDHLRGLMEKAVTKKRGELLILIKNGGDRPSGIDDVVWKRLQALADSNQRHQKSEQGRHANSCRKSFGRTGSIGVNGVREKLRLRLGRSPDPDEVVEEMERDKGYRGQKRKCLALSMRSERNSPEALVSEEEVHDIAVGRRKERTASKAFEGEPARKNATVASEEGYVFAGKTDSGQNTNTGTVRKKMSKDDYIQQLQSRIEVLEAHSAKTSTPNTAWHSESPVSAQYESSE